MEKPMPISPADAAKLIDELGKMPVLYGPETMPQGVWFNDPHTTVRWADGTTTTVTCGQSDFYDEQTGFLLCCAKRLFGNSGEYLKVMRKLGVPETTKAQDLVWEEAFNFAGFFSKGAPAVEFKFEGAK